MPTHDQSPPRQPVPFQVVNELFAAGLDVHRAQLAVDHDLDPRRSLQSALVRLDRTIMTVLRAALADGDSGPTTREQVVSSTFAALTHGLACAFDLNEHLRDLARHGAGLPDVRAVAFVIGEADGTPHLSVTAPAQPALRALGHLRPSPAWDTYVSGRPQTVADLTTDIRWPLFAARASAAGHQAVHTMPVRRQENTLGALVLFLARPGPLRPDDVRVARTLADLAAISVLVHAGPRHSAPDSCGGRRVLPVTPVGPPTHDTHLRPDPPPGNPRPSQNRFRK